MLRSDAIVPADKERAASPFEVYWATVRAALALTGSAMLLGANAVRSAANYWSGITTERSWPMTGPGVWRDSGPWWSAATSSFAFRDNAPGAWGSLMAAGLEVMRAWTGPHVSPFGTGRADAGDSEPCRRPSVAVTPYSAYRTDGGHAAAQIAMAAMPVRAEGPCADGEGRHIVP
ncbi:MAG TPA: hypothetical protein VNK52_04615 [Hyphomicrobiaceae bacterium]|nr:hypothetical protein [Hyphomicrobiaceae bacterium]